MTLTLLRSALRKRALRPGPVDLGYMTWAHVVVMARVPNVVPCPWWEATDTERRMFLLFVAEALE